MTDGPRARPADGRKARTRSGGPARRAPGRDRTSATGYAVGHTTGSAADRTAAATALQTLRRPPPQLACPGVVQRHVGEQLMGGPLPPVAGGPPLVHVAVYEQLLLETLEGAPPDAQLPCVLGQGEPGLAFGQPLHVQDQDLRVAAQTRMAHDIVRCLRVAPGGRDSMPKHPSGLRISTRWVKALGSVLEHHRGPPRMRTRTYTRTHTDRDDSITVPQPGWRADQRGKTPLDQVTYRFVDRRASPTAPRNARGAPPAPPAGAGGRPSTSRSGHRPRRGRHMIPARFAWSSERTSSSRRPPQLRPRPALSPQKVESASS